MYRLASFAIVLLLALGGCASGGSPQVPGGESASEPPTAGARLVGKGLASWYGEPYHGRQTASGEIYDMTRLTAAHRDLPFGTRVLVRRRDDGQEVVVRINDRGPFVRGRIIDLSRAAARRVGLEVDGIAPVEIWRLPGNTAPIERPDPGEVIAAECFWVQVGAFGDAANAAAAEARIEQESTLEALVIEGPNGLSRVRSGPFDSRAEAETAHSMLFPDWPQATVVPCG